MEHWLNARFRYPDRRKRIAIPHRTSPKKTLSLEPLDMVGGLGLLLHIKDKKSMKHLVGWSVSEMVT